MTLRSTDGAEVLSVIQLRFKQWKAIIYGCSEFSVVLSRLMLSEQHMVVEVAATGKVMGSCLLGGAG